MLGKISKKNFLILLLTPFAFLHAENRSSTISEMYDLNCHTSTHVNEHLQLLSYLAKNCSSIVEIGGQKMMASWALLEGLKNNGKQEKNYVSIDLHKPLSLKLDHIKQAAKDENIKFAFWEVNDLYINIEPCDMLYIDSIHTYRHLSCELEAFHQNVRKYICIKDTGNPWGHRDDPKFMDDYTQSHFQLTKKGLLPAVAEFLNKHPEWSVMDHRQNNFGLTILKRANTEVVKEPVYHSKVAETLKSKIILCTGPSFNRYDMLKNVTESDMELIPFKKIFVATNDPRIEPIQFNGKKPVITRIENQGHQLDCLNCIISSIKQAASDPDVLDDDIILFKHESVFINDMQLIKKSISKILEGYDMVDRIMSHLAFAKATDVFFVKVSAIREKIKNIQLLTSYPDHAPYCEQYFSQYVINDIKKIYMIPGYHLCCGWVELGFYHYHASDWKGYASWDRSNYNELFSKP